MYESNVNGDGYTSSMTHSLKKRNMRKDLCSNQAFPFKTNQFKEDIDSKHDIIELDDDYIHVDKSNLSSTNGHYKKKPICLGDMQKDNSKQSLKRNYTFNRLTDSDKKYMTRTHSTVDISAASNNKSEIKLMRISLEEIRAKIAYNTSLIVSNDFTIKEHVSQLKGMKKKKEQIKIQLPNRISEKESFEEIYKSNIMKYTKSNYRKGNYCVLKQNANSSFDYGTIAVSKHEITSLSIKQFKEAVIAILNDLLINNRYEIIYQNLIEAVITRTYTSLNSTMELCRGDLFFPKLSKALCDIYPTINKEVLTVLLKYTVKLSYIESILEKEMNYLSTEYKIKKSELIQSINKNKEENMLIEAELKELKNKENECMANFDLLADISDKTTMNSSHYFKESIQKGSFLFEDEKNEQSFGNKEMTKYTSNHLSPHLYCNKKTSERSSKITTNNESNIFHRCASIAGSTVLKLDSSFPIMNEDSANCLIKTPRKNSKKHHRNKQLSFDIQRNHIIAQNSTQYTNSPNYIYSTQSQTQQCKPINFKPRNKNNEDALKGRSHSILSISNNDIGTRYDYYISLLHDTYCYCKFISKLDPKFNPLLPYSNTPELLGYDKGFISYDQPTESLLFVSCINKHRKHRIKLSSIQGTILINLIKDIISIHKEYQNMLQELTDKPIEVDKFILRKEFDDILLSNNDKIKSALCSFFSFSIVLSSNEKIELIFVSYNEFKVWYNSLGYLISNKNA